MNLPFEHLEETYELLAAAIARLEPGREAVFLAKLTLCLAQRLGDIEAIRESVRICAQD